jgi:hypothetical protein
MYFELLGHRNLEVQSAQKMFKLPKDVCGLCPHTRSAILLPTQVPKQTPTKLAKAEDGIR